MERFRVALSGDFRRADGSPTYPSFDLTPLTSDPRIETVWVDPVDGVIPAAGLEGCHALILLMPRFARQSVPSGNTLAIVARFGVGYDNVDLAACDEHGIAAVITPDGVRRPVAVSVITYILALSQKLLVKDRLCRAGPEGWAKRSDHMGEGLVGKTLGQLGLGNIGAEVCRLAKPFDLKLIAYDPYANVALARELGVELVSEEEVFRRSDYLSVSIPLSEATRGFVNAARLKLMKPTAYLINTARGPVVDQKALYRALTDGTIAGAGLDVFEIEPAPADEPLLKLDNVIVTPHSLCWTDECFAGNGAADIAAVLAVMKGETPRGIVNRGVVDSPAWKQRLAEFGRRFA
ncbi:D-3-phosphoglycerate dehydrogenase [Tepidamorphus gemmatus]|uniref:D-3-phosphoglycerate dehydrogenase n=1 Tax=Tepidamorphus gemmatus TaxID=747076 RepID=A0A4R3ML13_9HYPH|nr:NAD(P)-dependent oxidoreductase [Tepidamorphus gemmatus]TCT13458.1 D-3-phosphoglycerate dehydrogenase [Tepidamorphus gemmatus]